LRRYRKVLPVASLVIQLALVNGFANTELTPAYIGVTNDIMLNSQ